MSSWVETYTFKREFPLRLADMTPEQRRYWQNENTKRANRRRIEDRAQRLPPDTAVAGGKVKKGGFNTMQRKMAERSKKEKQKALDDHKGSAAMIAARELQIRGHVVYSLAVVGESYGGPLRNLWVVDLAEHPVPTDTMIAWSRKGVPGRDDRIAAAVPVLRTTRKKATPSADNAARARTMISEVQRRHRLSENALRALVGSSIMFTLDAGGIPTNQTLTRIQNRIAEFDKDRGVIDLGHIEEVGNLRELIRRTMDRFSLTMAALGKAAAGDNDLVGRIMRGGTPKRHNELRLRALIAALESGEVTL